MALAAVPLRWSYDDPLQLCRSQGDMDTLDDLAQCMQRFVVPEGTIPAADWTEDAGFIPNPQQRHDLDKLVRKMTAAPTAAVCKKLLLPASLKAVYRPPALFRDTERRESVCVLLERVHRGRFVAGWAWLVVRLQPEEEEGGAASEGQQAAAAPRAPAGPAGWSSRGRGPLRRLHLGAPHAGFEGPVDLQAVALFRRLPSLARTVVVSGKHRRATDADSACLPGLGYPASDPSHNDRDAFNVISFALLQLEQKELGESCSAGGGSGRGTAVFLQLHGKAADSCPASTVFASGGFGRNATAFYGRVDTAVAEVVSALEAAMAPARPRRGPGGGGDVSADGGGWVVHTPYGDPGCALVAFRNVFGRAVNGVPRKDTCSRTPSAEGGGGGCFGAFVHVEQAAEARSPEAWGVWVRALRALQPRMGS